MGSYYSGGSAVSSYGGGYNSSYNTYAQQDYGQQSYGGGYAQNYQQPQIDLPCPPNYTTNENLPDKYVDAGYGKITRNYNQNVYANQTVGVKNNVTYTPYLNRTYVDQGTCYNVAPLQFTEGCMPPPPSFCPPAINFSCPPPACDYGSGYAQQDYGYGGYQQQNNYQNNYGGGGYMDNTMYAPGGAYMTNTMYG